MLCYLGHMLVSWMCSCLIDQHHYLYGQLSVRDTKVLVVQFCTHLLAAGVIRKLEDDASPTAIFRVCVYTVKVSVWLVQ